MSSYVSREHDATLTSSRALSARARELTLRITSTAPFRWRAGQYVELEVALPGTMRRIPYSIASADLPSHEGAFEIAVGWSEDSPENAALQNMPNGTAVRVFGPDGSFTRDTVRDVPALLIGTGTGVAPLRAIVQEELNRNDGPPIILLSGAREEDDALWADEFYDLAKHHPRFRFEPTLSRGSTSWQGRIGRVQTHVEEVLRSLGPVPVFLSGSDPMVIDMRRILVEQLHHPAHLVHTEAHIVHSQI